MTLISGCLTVAAMFAPRRLPGEQVGAIGLLFSAAAALPGPKPLQVGALVLGSVYPDIEVTLSVACGSR